MRKIFLLINLVFLGFFSFAQIVENYSGQSTISGLEDNSNKDLALYNNPHGIDIGPDGIIYVADRFNHVIRKIDINGEVSTIAGDGTIGDTDGPALSASFNEPWDVCAGNNGEVYVADAKNNKIRVISEDGQVRTYAGTGNVGFTDSSNPLASSFYWPSGLEYDHETNELYVAGHLSHLIRKIAVTGEVTTIAGTKTDFPNNFGSVDGVATFSKFYRPYGIHLGPNKELYIADEWNDQIRVLENGIVRTLGGQEDVPGYKEGGADTSLYNFPWDVTTGANGKLYVLDGNNHVIREIDPVTGISKFFAGGVATTGASNGTLTNARFNGATGIEYYNGSIYIADAFNHVIRRIILLEDIALNIDEEQPCTGDSVTVLANPTYYDKYYWYSGDNFITTTTEPQLRYLFSGSDIVSVRGERTGVGLSNSDTLNLAQISEEEAIIIEPLNTFCEGDSVRLSTPYDLVTWNNGVLSESIVINSGGEYSFERFENGCLVAYGETTVNFLMRPVIFANPKESIIEEGDSVKVTVTGADFYTWSTGDSTSELYFNEELSHSVFGTNSIDGCQSESVEVLITVIPVQDTTGLDEPFFPNAFSPNGDGSNDSYEVLGIRLVPESSFEVYNRWGQLLYNKDNYLNDWVGINNNGDEMIEGTYFYVFINKETNKKYNGYVLLKR